MKSLMYRFYVCSRLKNDAIIYVLKDFYGQGNVYYLATFTNFERNKGNG